ncbi:5725_t:CDS:1, partial [Racocetra fulgida]
DGQPWTDDEINMFSAWIYDGKQQGVKITEDEGNKISSYMEPTFPTDVKIDESTDEPLDPSSLNFQDHVLKMFALGYRNTMWKITGYLDLHDYNSVNSNKDDIFLRLTRLETDITTPMMPRRNPWPRKNILLFYRWAIQGQNSKENSTSTPTDWPSGSLVLK